jgi:hypothetical protein
VGEGFLFRVAGHNVMPWWAPLSRNAQRGGFRTRHDASNGSGDVTSHPMKERKVGASSRVGTKGSDGLICAAAAPTPNWPRRPRAWAGLP